LISYHNVLVLSIPNFNFFQDFSFPSFSSFAFFFFSFHCEFYLKEF